MRSSPWHASCRPCSTTSPASKSSTSTDVPPTSHVVEVTSSLREDEVRPCLPARGRPGPGAGRGRGGLPGAESPGMSAGLLELSAAAAAAEIAAGDALRGRAVRRLPRARRRRPRGRRAGPRLLHLGGRRGPAGACRITPRRRPAGRQGPLLHRGRPEPVGLADPRGLPAALYRHGRERLLQRAGATLLAKTNQDEFAMGSSNENSRLRPGAQPVGPRARPRRLLRRQRRGGGSGPGPVGARHRHRRVDPPAGRPLRRSSA